MSLDAPPSDDPCLFGTAVGPEAKRRTASSIDMSPTVPLLRSIGDPLSPRSWVPRSRRTLRLRPASRTDAFDLHAHRAHLETLRLPRRHAERVEARIVEVDDLLARHADEMMMRAGRPRPRQGR